MRRLYSSKPQYFPLTPSAICCIDIAVDGGSAVIVGRGREGVSGTTGVDDNVT